MISENILNNTKNNIFSSFKEFLSDLSSINSIEVLRKMPLLTKNEILQNPQPFLRNNIDEMLYEAKTGGTLPE